MVKSQIIEYKKIASLILEGDLYRLKNPYTDNAFCVAMVSKDKASAYVVYECLRTNFSQGYDTLKIRGLDESKIYCIEELGQKVKGSTLINFGIKIPNLTDYEAWVLHITEI